MVLNLSSRAQRYDLPGTDGGHILLSTQLGRISETVSEEIELGSNEGVLSELPRTAAPTPNV